MELVTDDRNAGLDAPDGRSFKPDDRGIISLPDDLAAYGERAARVTPLFHVHRRQYGGFDAAELRRRYDAWRAARR